MKEPRAALSIDYMIIPIFSLVTCIVLVVVKQLHYLKLPLIVWGVRKKRGKIGYIKGLVVIALLKILIHLSNYNPSIIPVILFN